MVRVRVRIQDTEDILAAFYKWLRQELKLTVAQHGAANVQCAMSIQSLKLMSSSYASTNQKEIIICLNVTSNFSNSTFMKCSKTWLYTSNAI